MLLAYGNTFCGIDWTVDEKKPPKYSRVYYVYGGEVEYRDALIKIFLKQGYLYIFPSESAYSMRQNTRDRLHCTFMHIDFFPFQIGKLIEVPVEGNNSLKHILCSIAECINENNVKLINAMADVFKLYCTEHGFFRFPDGRISKALSYIAEHAGDKITVEMLSSLCGYNPQYFIRIFKKITGLSPYRYIVDYRLKEAKKMLVMTDAPVSQIADLTGYKDIKAFSRSFKQNFSISPSAYRNSRTIKP